MKKNKKSLATSLITGLFVAAISVSSLTPMLLAKGGDESRLRCKASERRGAEMGAEFRDINNGTRIRFSVEVGDLADNTGVSTTVVRDGAIVFGPAAVPPGFAGEADLNLDSQDGDLVPALSSGDQVNVFQNGAGLLSCFLR